MSVSLLYHDTIKQHASKPTGENSQFCSTHGSEGYNPSCGDEINMYVELSESGQIRNIGFTADACAICKASASLLCEHSNGQTVPQVQKTFTHIKQALNNQSSIEYDSLSSLSAVANHKSRINCALLPWQTLLNIDSNFASDTKPN